MKKLYPIWREASAHCFVDASKYAPVVVGEDGEKFRTAPLRAGVKVDLLGLSNVNHEVCPTLDRKISLDAIYVELAGHVKKIQLDEDNFLEAMFIDVDFKRDTTAELHIGFDAEIDIFGTDAEEALKMTPYIGFKTKLSGNINTQEASVIFNFTKPDVKLVAGYRAVSEAEKTISDAIAAMRVIGYDLGYTEQNLNTSK